MFNKMENIPRKLCILTILYHFFDEHLRLVVVMRGDFRQYGLHSIFILSHSRSNQKATDT